ncbi:hypothetical protein P389DRAFT_174366 [Cystobasidium minutum MCA 4210]|uniref:uncharacterized protein n=1 Tax=Cystobasidium minutum MCA 4210 TaxID=1397322 RepID=UPI0034CFABB8|eukprot:jgi/Rhomi1/174366/fgenesh1_kg.7_\
MPTASQFAHVTLLGLYAAIAQVHAAPAPQITSALASATSEAGSAVSSVTSAAASDVTSVASSAEGAFSSVFASAVLSIPSPSAVEEALGIDNSTLASEPVSALLVPSYSNFTQQGWNVRFNAFAYKLPENVSDSNLSKIFDLLGIDNSTLNATEQTLLANRTTDLASVPIPGLNNLTVQVEVNGRPVGSPLALQAADDFGEIDQFMVVPGLANITGNSEQINGTVIVQLYAQNVTGPSNSTTILVPGTGISVVSDIDDVLRVTKVYVPTTGLKNSFAEPYMNFDETPEVFANWDRTLPNVSFHYDTTTPLELTRTYVEYLFNNYPLGSLDMRPINLTEPSQVLDARQQSLTRLFQTFPQRKFVLVGDTSSSTLLTAYPQIAQTYPEQLACIFIRNTSATDSDDKLPYDTSKFQSLNSSQYFFYTHPADLFGLDIANGQCVNQSIPQNVTFGEQGGPFRL